MAMPTYLKNLITYTQDLIVAAALDFEVVERAATEEAHAVRVVKAVLRRRPEPAGSR